MLDNLLNPNLSGIGGSIYYNSSDIFISQVMTSLFAFLTLIIVFLILASIVGNTKTEKYRRQLVDLYVAGIVRQLAKKEGIDLDEELKQFIRQQKKKHLEEKGLDKVIEIEKAEQIIDEQEKALKK